LKICIVLGIFDKNGNTLYRIVFIIGSDFICTVCSSWIIQKKNQRCKNVNQQTDKQQTAKLNEINVPDEFGLLAVLV